MTWASCRPISASTTEPALWTQGDFTNYDGNVGVADLDAMAAQLWARSADIGRRVIPDYPG